MTPEQFGEGIKILQAAFRKKYSDESYALFWAEFQGHNGNGFILTCRELARTLDRLPTLSQIFNALPKEVEEMPTEVDGNLWLDKVREVYNRFAGLSVPERNALYANLNPEEKALMQEAVVLYEEIWPRVCEEYPNWATEQKAAECLRRYIGKRHKDATPQEMIAGVKGYDGKIYKWPAWYAKKYHPAGAEGK